jgi:protein-L-isoaspartate(D-aspartate) O-methyltransferase
MGFMSFDFRAARLTMVESQVRTSDVTDTDLQDAMRTVPRERFCPEGKAFLAYAETEIEYAPGQFLMAPRDIAKLLQLLKPRSGETALAIQAPYGAALLRQMGLSVVEHGASDPVAKGAYDVILTEGAVHHAPLAWLEGLNASGRLGVVERSGPMGKAKIFVPAEEGFGARDGFDSAPRYIDGFEPKASFAL